jgi:glycosyltransferase involved in cell wall biosynthesis
MQNIAQHTSLPKVSILIPTHNRPEYFEVAFKSALNQTYPNTQICISDNGTNDETEKKVVSYLAKYGNIRYYRKEGMTATENWDKALELSDGYYVNYLMDDDIYHPEKISRMVACFLSNPNVGIVTSYRKLIDERGAELPDLPQTKKLFENDILISGKSLGHQMLVQGSNMIGEPTTALIKREQIKRGFGYFHDTRYTVISDVAEWLSVLEHNDCAYLHEALSYFRLHEGQDQKSQKNIRLTATIEWFQLFFESYKRAIFFEDTNELAFVLKQKLEALVDHLATNVTKELMPEYDTTKALQTLHEGVIILRSFGYKVNFNL